MKEYMILFSACKDRPGIVDDISTVLFEHGANIEDSRMAVMGGCFSTMTFFSCEKDQLATIKNGLKNIEELGIECFLHKAESPENEQSFKVALPLKIEITAMDHPGIVQNVVNVLGRHEVNILSINTNVTGAPLSGASLFNLTLEAAVPENIMEVKDALLELAAEIDLDLNFRP